MSGAPKQQAVYSKKAKMIFTLQSNGEYEPYYYDVEEYVKDGKIHHRGKKIEKGTIFYDYIAFVRHASDDIDKNTGKKRRGYGEMYQYAIGFQVVKSCMNLQGEDIIVAISRQAGKSHIVRKTFGFCIIFIPKYTYIPQLRYYMTFVAVKNDLAIDQINKLIPSIDQSIELFNMMNPETPIITANEDKSLINTKLKKEFNRSINGKSVPYSAMDGISFQSKVSAGYTSHCIVVD